jgi:alkylation response protein AidB-like acyl-CoA dehydrogenase
MFRLSTDQQSFVDRASQFATTHLASRADAVDTHGAFPAAAVQALGEDGFLGLTIPTEFGGKGQSLRVACAVLDQLGQRCPSTSMVYLMHLCGVACYAAAAQKTGPHLRAAAHGSHLSTLAFSERGSRSHFWAPVSRARANGGGITSIDADKSFVTSAGHADGYVVSTGSASGTQPLESSIYLVLKGDPGLSVAGKWTALGLRGNSSAPMRLQGVAVSDDRALSADGKGLDLLLSVVLPIFQLGTAAVAIGIAEAAVAATQRHLTTARLEHMNSTLAGLPTLRARLAEMRLETDKARAHLAATLDAIENPGPATQLLVLEAKGSATEVAVSVTDKAMRACGGAALTPALGIERLFRDARALIVMAPTTDQAYDIIGRALCGMEVLG